MGKTEYIEAFVRSSAIRHAIGLGVNYEHASFEMDAFNGGSVVAIAVAGADPLEKQRSPKPIYSVIVAVSDITVTSIRLRYNDIELGRISIDCFVKAGNRLALNWLLTDQIA